MSLGQANDVSAEIAGVSTEAGLFTFVVNDSNADAETDSVIINITVQVDAPTPALTNVTNVNIVTQFEQSQAPLKSHNTGGAAAGWTLSGAPLPDGVVFVEEFYVMSFAVDGVFKLSTAQLAINRPVE